MKIFLSLLFLSQCYEDAFATNENRDDNEQDKKGMLKDINFDFAFSVFITIQKSKNMFHFKIYIRAVHIRR